MAADSKSASSLRSLPQLLLNFLVQYNLKITSVIYLLYLLPLFTKMMFKGGDAPFEKRPFLQINLSLELSVLVGIVYIYLLNSNDCLFFAVYV